MFLIELNVNMLFMSVFMWWLLYAGDLYLCVAGIFHMAGRSPALPRRGPCLGRQQTPRDEVPSLRSVILTNKVAMVLLIDEAATLL